MVDFGTWNSGLVMFSELRGQTPPLQHCIYCSLSHTVHDCTFERTDSDRFNAKGGVTLAVRTLNTFNHVVASVVLNCSG